jgi:ribosome-binding factor A
MRPSNIQRSVRVAERIREEIASAIGRRLSDPRVADVIVTRAHVTDDLQLARVYVRLGSGGDAASIQNALSGLERAAGLLRRMLGPALGLRRSPVLEFRFDDDQEKADRIEAVLAEIHKGRGE